jgi:acyl-CoA hydrolase
VGHLVMCSAELTYVGRTSMEVRVEVIAENPLRSNARTTNVAYLVYVAIDANGRPIEVPELEYETPEQHLRAQRAEQRQAYRKQQRDLEKA